jgi:4-amino-4-deoxy-L-arabinose transferase-like glycosyltransferase
MAASPSNISADSAESSSESKQKRDAGVKTVLVLLALYFAVRLPWLFLVPMVEAPDEFSHFWVLKFMAEHLRLPEAAEILGGGPSAVYGSYPPMGYLPHVLTSLVGTAISKAVDISVWCRFGSLLAGAVIPVCALLIGQEIFSRRRDFQLALPLMVIFHPQLVLVNSYANCDTTASALSALALVLLFKMLKEGLATKLSLFLGITLGWLALTKYTAYAIFPTAALAMAMAAYLQGQGWIKLVSQGAITGATTILLSLWWFLRNGAMFDGDYLGTKTMYHTWAKTYGRQEVFKMSPWYFLKNHRWWRTILYSYWGYFGYMTREMAHPIYFVYLGYLILSGLGLGRMATVSLPQQIKSIWAVVSAKLSAENQLERPAKLLQPAYWTVLIACLTINFLAMLYASTANLGVAQGRYLFPSELPCLAILLGGLYVLPPGWNKKAMLSLVVFNCLTCIYAFVKLLLLPEYSFNFFKTYTN